MVDELDRMDRLGGPTPDDGITGIVRSDRDRRKRKLAEEEAQRRKRRKKDEIVLEGQSEAEEADNEPKEPPDERSSESVDTEKPPADGIDLKA